MASEEKLEACPNLPEAVCRDCGRHNPVWFAPNAVWNLVMGGPDATDDPGGIVCPICFIRRAEAAGVVPTAWMVQPEAAEGEDLAARPSVGVGELRDVWEPDPKERLSRDRDIARMRDRAALSSIPVGGLEVAAADAVAGEEANQHSARASPAADVREGVAVSRKLMAAIRFQTPPQGYGRDADAAIRALDGALLATVEELERQVEENDDLDQTFKLRWSADMRAIKRWRDAGPGRELTLPDHADLVVWLLERSAAGQSLTGKSEDGSTHKNPSTPPSEAG